MLDKLRAIREEKAAEDRGFTLIELLVVVVIIGILIAIAIPLYLNYQKGAHDKSAQSDLRAAVSTYQQCYTDNNNAYPVDAGTTHAATFTVTCGTATETVNLSDGSSLKYTSDGTNFQLASWNSGGDHSGVGSAYTYSSATGGSIH